MFDVRDIRCKKLLLRLFPVSPGDGIVDTLRQSAFIEIVFFKAEIVAEFVEQCLAYFVAKTFRIVLYLIAQIFNIQPDGAGHGISVVGKLGVAGALEEAEQVLVVTLLQLFIRTRVGVECDRQFCDAGTKILGKAAHTACTS